MDRLSHSESVVVAASPETLYDMVADITRTGEWSPVCATCWWDEDDGPHEGAWFTGQNETAERTWRTRSRVVAAEPGHEFAWIVGGTYVRWGYTFTPVDDGTRVRESWEFLPGGIAMFEEKHGDRGRAEIASRAQDAHEGIPATLAALKASAESG